MHCKDHPLKESVDSADEYTEEYYDNQIKSLSNEFLRQLRQRQEIISGFKPDNAAIRPATHYKRVYKLSYLAPPLPGVQRKPESALIPDCLIGTCMTRINKTGGEVQRVGIMPLGTLPDVWTDECHKDCK